MSVCLATTWYPRGESSRLSHFLPILKEKYAGIVIVLIPTEDQESMQLVSSPEFTSDAKIRVILNEDRRSGRYLAIQNALETDASHVHYVDMDRLLHWVETEPEEWTQVVVDIKSYDCVTFGRTQQAFATHPQALQTTEVISNRVVSAYLQKEIDVSAGSKSFSRAAAQYLVDYGSKDNSIGTDAEWPILLDKAGFQIQYSLVNGLDWESADQYQPKAASREMQSKAAAEYDSNPEHWKRRVEIAEEIVKTAILTSQKPWPSRSDNLISTNEFDKAAVFEVDDYMYFYSEALTDERTETEVSALVSLLELDKPKKILDLACGFGRHTNRLAALGHSMTGIDLTPGFLEIARQDAIQRNVEVRYEQGDMRTIIFENEFDCVMLLFTAFGYFSDEENLQVLINARRALVPGGLLIFDGINRDTFLKGMQPYIAVEKEGNMMVDRNSFNSLQGRLYNHRVVFRSGIRKDKPYFVRLYNPSEIMTLLIQAGLELEHIYGSWDAQEVTQDTRRLFVIACKPE